jgi:stearoyl-CoA desaturase (delta-9 desaturase)
MWSGLFELPLWGYVAVALVLTHVTIASVTIYLHRHQAHRGLDLHPAVAHFFRFWLWLTTSMVTREWVAVHRKHHAKCETEADPHSPQVKGINRVLWTGAGLYRVEAGKRETLEKFGHGTPDDWIERRLYSRFKVLGIILMAVIDVVLFGLAGLAIWAVQMIWIPFWAAGVINGIGHFWGYRNFEPTDASTNISPLGILIGGEELHNNHHAFPSSAKFALKPWEFDLGWFYIRGLEKAGLARVKRVAPKPVIVPTKQTLDVDTVKAVVTNRLHVMSSYAGEVILPTLQEESRQMASSYKRLLRRARRALVREESLIDERQRQQLESALSISGRLQTVYEFRQRLQAVWARSAASHEALLKNLQAWCAQAEASGIQALQEFSRKLRCYALQPA